MDRIPEEKNEFDMASNVDSRVSKNIEQIVQAKGKDPRKKMAKKGTTPDLPEAGKTSSLNAENLAKLAESKQINEMYYR